MCSENDPKGSDKGDALLWTSQSTPDGTASSFPTSRDCASEVCGKCDWQAWSTVVSNLIWGLSGTSSACRKIVPDKSGQLPQRHGHRLLNHFAPVILSHSLIPYTRGPALFCAPDGRNAIPTCIALASQNTANRSPFVPEAPERPIGLNHHHGYRSRDCRHVHIRPPLCNTSPRSFINICCRQCDIFQL
jgi:hypothetical protein